MRFTVAIFLLLASVSIVGCRKPFSGDGVLTDNGFLSYPRYSIIFSPLDATNAGVRQYKLSGAPTLRMTFSLAVHEVGKSEDVITRLRGPGYQGWSLSVDIRKSDGTSVARAHAPIKDWQASQSPQEVMLWHENLRDVSFNRSSAYEISVQVLGADANSEPLVLQPVLEGGGNETP